MSTTDNYRREGEPSGSRITKVEAQLLRIPTRRAHALAMTTMHAQRSVLVRVTADTGMQGVGEAATIADLAYCEESPEGICLTVERFFAPVIKGMSATRPAQAMAALGKMAVGNPFAKAAVETALFDLAGRSIGAPVSELLGGRVLDRLSVAWTLASGDTEQDIEEARRMLAKRRHNAFKLKIGRRPWREDVAHVRAIADALGEAASIRVDVNQAWDLATAKRALGPLSEAGVELIEQPLHGADHVGAKELRSLGPVAILADEALRGGPSQARALIDARAADALSLKILQAGGLRACKAVGEMALASGVGLYGGTMLEGGVGTIASAHAFSTLPGFRWGTELFGPLLLTQDILARPITYADFGMIVPTGPGLGIELNEDAVREFAVENH